MEISSAAFQEMVPLEAERREPDRADVHCLWCGMAFPRRATGGSAQRFCSTEHRKAFWTAARRWTMRAIETGLLSVDCLKTAQTSVHAAGGGVLARGKAVHLAGRR